MKTESSETLERSP